ncbi:MAG: hypothetical protein CVV18_00115 [Gammaproteobacteria bacterium HGW-Gammaproteobacteria-8]|nr:MAG: hypothetical protein CVV18_00115 [Gammaproteobacteria bacterium HGW-Gammaproteobacteria-8]
MNAETRHRIITVGFALVPVFIVVWLIQSPAGGAGSLDQHRLAGRLLQLEHGLATLGRQARNYLDNAPRDHDHYFRDVEIVYPNLMSQVDSVDVSFDVLALEPTARSDPGLATLVSNWEAFRNKLDEQLGVDPQLPRLEWGARHIAERLPALSEQISEQRQRLYRESASTGRAGPLALLLALITALAMSAWSVRTAVQRG